MINAPSSRLRCDAISRTVSGGRCPWIRREAAGGGVPKPAKSRRRKTSRCARSALRARCALRAGRDRPARGLAASRAGVPPNQNGQSVASFAPVAMICAHVFPVNERADKGTAARLRLQAPLAASRRSVRKREIQGWRAARHGRAAARDRDRYICHLIDPIRNAPTVGRSKPGRCRSAAGNAGRRPAYDGDFIAPS